MKCSGTNASPGSTITIPLRGSRCANVDCLRAGGVAAKLKTLSRSKSDTEAYLAGIGKFWKPPVPSGGGANKFLV